MTRFEPDGGARPVRAPRCETPAKSAPLDPADLVVRQTPAASADGRLAEPGPDPRAPQLLADRGRDLAASLDPRSIGRSRVAIDGIMVAALTGRLSADHGSPGWRGRPSRAHARLPANAVVRTARTGGGSARPSTSGASVRVRLGRGLRPRSCVECTGTGVRSLRFARSCAARTARTSAAGASLVRGSRAPAGRWREPGRRAAGAGSGDRAAGRRRDQVVRHPHRGRDDRRRDRGAGVRRGRGGHRR